MASKLVYCKDLRWEKQVFQNWEMSKPSMEAIDPSIFTFLLGDERFLSSLYSSGSSFNQFMYGGFTSLVQYLLQNRMQRSSWIRQVQSTIVSNCFISPVFNVVLQDPRIWLIIQTNPVYSTAMSSTMHILTSMMIGQSSLKYLPKLRMNSRIGKMVLMRFIIMYILVVRIQKDSDFEKGLQVLVCQQIRLLAHTFLMYLQQTWVSPQSHLVASPFQTEDAYFSSPSIVQSRMHSEALLFDMTMWWRQIMIFSLETILVLAFARWIMQLMQLSPSLFGPKNRRNLFLANRSSLLGVESVNPMMSRQLSRDFLVLEESVIPQNPNRIINKYNNIYAESYIPNILFLNIAKNVEIEVLEEQAILIRRIGDWEGVEHILAQGWGNNQALREWHPLRLDFDQGAVWQISLPPIQF